MLWTLVRRAMAPYRWSWISLIVLQIVQTMATLWLPNLNARIIDKGVSTGNTGVVWSTGGIMLLVSLAQVVCAVGAVRVGSRLATSAGRDLRAEMFAKVQGFSSQEVGRFGAPTLITRTTNDIQQVQMVLLLSLTIMAMAPIMLVGGIVMALKEDARLSLLMVVIVPLLAISVGMVISRMRPHFRKMQKRIDAINGVLREQVTGLRVVRAFVREGFERQRFAEANNALYTTGIRAGRLMAMIFPIVLLIMNVSSVSVIWFGGKEIEAGRMQVGSLIAFMSYLMYILMAVMMASMMFALVPRAAVAAERIGEVMATDTTVVEPTNPIPMTQRRGVVELRGAVFGFPGADEPVLKGITLRAEPGKTTAIIGSTGAGKTTLLRLIPRLIDVAEGEVLVDGVNVKDAASDDLHSLMGLVPQKAYLFSGTIADTLRFGRPDATTEEMWAALEIAQARSFVEELPDGLDAVVAQGGANFSGGQRQRLAIARAVIRQPLVYLFDDAFSALDYTTDAALRAALAKVTSEATVIIVAQRVSTIRDADTIVVIDDGVVVGSGIHDELLASNVTYQEIVQSQLSAEEAA